MPHALFDSDEEQSHYIDLGNNHFIKFCEYLGDERTAIRDKHLTKDGKRCEGFVPIKGRAWANEFKDVDGYQAWDAVSFNPLTLSPSLLCTACGDHGHIDGGKWVPCNG